MAWKSGRRGISLLSVVIALTIVFMALVPILGIHQSSALSSAQLEERMVLLSLSCDLFEYFSANPSHLDLFVGPKDWLAGIEQPFASRPESPLPIRLLPAPMAQQLVAMEAHLYLTTFTPEDATGQPLPGFAGALPSFRGLIVNLRWTRSGDQPQELERHFVVRTD